MRYTLVREQNRKVAISVGVRPRTRVRHAKPGCHHTGHGVPQSASTLAPGGDSPVWSYHAQEGLRGISIVLQLSQYQRGPHCAILMHAGLARSNYSSELQSYAEAIGRAHKRISQ